jgi:hypothetical protein
LLSWPGMAGEAARTRRSRHVTATLLSQSIAILFSLLASTGRADEMPPPPGAQVEVAQPARAVPPPSAETLSSPLPLPLPPPPPAPPRPARPLAFTQHRHYVGAQLGGTGLLQAVYRYRAVGPVHLEVGGLGADHVGNASVGVLVGVPFGDRLFPYAGFGGGWAASFGPRSPDGCSSAKASDCPGGEGSDTMLFLHLRAGIGFAVGRSNRHLLAADVGGWVGTELSSRTDALGMTTRWSTRLLTPIAGLSYFFAL